MKGGALIVLNTEMLDLACAYRTTKSGKAQDIIHSIYDQQYLAKHGEDNFYVNIEHFLERSVMLTTLISEHDYELPCHTRTYEHTDIVFTNEPLVDTLTKERAIYGKTISVLSSGKSQNICGEFQFGKSGYDETIGYCSTAFLSCLRFYENFWLENKKYDNKGFYNDNIVCALHVPVIKNSSYKYISQPYLINYYVCSAVNRNIVSRKAVTRLKDVNKVMKERMRASLKAMVANSDKASKRVAILSPFGCGAMGNSISSVAHIWYELLELEGWKKYFSKIVFSCNFKETAVALKMFENAYESIS